MSILRHSQSVSVAHRYWNNLWSHERNREMFGTSASPVGVGSNLRVEVEVAGTPAFDFAPVAARIKRLLDHRNLIDDEPAFADRPSTLESVAEFLAKDLFAQAPAYGQWHGLIVWELDRFGCRVEPQATGVEFTFEVRNLVLTVEARIDAESGLAVRRADAVGAVEEIFTRFSHGSNETEFIWMERLYGDLKKRLPGLKSLSVDLGSHKLMKVDSSSPCFG